MSKKYYFGTIRKIVAAFGLLFSDIHIDKEYHDGTFQDIRVPLNYGPRQAWYAKLKEKMRDDEEVAKIATTLPRISYEMNDLAYANDRKVITTNRVLHRETNPIVGKIYHQFAPMPWDFKFTVSIAVKNIEDGLRIIEQVVPLFRPDHTLTIEELPALKITEDVTVNMIGITSSDTFEGSISSTSRVITWDLDFILAGHIFPPITNVKLIEEINNTITEHNSEVSENMSVTGTENTDGTITPKVEMS